MGDVPSNVAATAATLAIPRSPAEPCEERELLRRAQKGSERAYEELIRRHQNRVFAVASRILRQREDVEDVAQQVFWKAYRSLKKFDMRSAFGTWLYKIAVNECLDFLRRKRSRPLLFESDLSEEQVDHMHSTMATQGVGANPAQRALLADAVERLLSRLSHEDRSILLLKEVEGFSVHEIARMFDLNVNTVKVRLFRSRTRLAEFWRRQNPTGRARQRRNGRGQ
jgi:RNA polymerase sigma-70 factor (ECF subfamily)